MFLRAFSTVGLLACATVEALLSDSHVSEHKFYKPNTIKKYNYWKALGIRPQLCLRYFWLKEKDLLVCGCDKCGTTSLFSYLYEVEFGHNYTWPYWPLVQEPLQNEHWEGKWRKLDFHSHRRGMLHVKNKFALFRDPKERLLAAWKSKFACDDLGFGTDDPDRHHMVPELYKLAGQHYTNDTYCIPTFEELVDLLAMVHRKKRAWKLDCHLLPQEKACFRDIPVQNWTKASVISDPDFERTLAKAIRAPPDVRIPHAHATHDFDPHLSERGQHLLDLVTRAEYQALGLSPKPLGSASGSTAPPSR